MFHYSTALLALATTSAALAQAPQLQISLGIRETGSTAPIGADGGTAGAIEWIDLDGQVLDLDGTWQQFTFRLDPADPLADPVTAFTGDGAVTGTAGTIEHIRIRNFQAITEPITLWIDDVADTITPSGGSPTTIVFGDFEGYSAGTEVMFQEPGFSGSTAGNVAGSPAPNYSDNYVFTASRDQPGSQEFGFQFIDNDPTRWIRLTTFSSSIGLTQASPTIAFDQLSVVTFWMRGGEAQPNLGSQGPGTAIAEMVGIGLDAGETSTYYTAGAPALAPGVVALSANGFPDVPFVGGNLVSFGGFLFALPLVADANGQTALPLTGDASPGDVVFQSAFLDMSLPGDPPLTITNAVNALIGP